MYLKLIRQLTPQTSPIAKNFSAMALHTILTASVFLTLFSILPAIYANPASTVVIMAILPAQIVGIHFNRKGFVRETAVGYLAIVS